MIDFKNPYNREEVLEFLQNSFLKDFQKDITTVDIPEQKHIQKAHSLGYSKELGLRVFEFLHEGSTEKRVTLTKEAFNVLRDSGTFKAIGIFYSKETEDWRFSLMTATPVVNEKGKVKTILSNPKRYSFLLGPNAKVHTPTKFLITKGVIQDFEDLKDRFSIEVVNKEFYKEISRLFMKLVGGTLGEGGNKEEYKALLKLPGVKDSGQTAQEFAVRLIGRLIFCWFLREKKDDSEESLMPHSLLSLDASRKYKDYYHSILEPIFFKVLNVPLNSRKEEKFFSNPYDKIPYLNGGLFSPHEDDFYSTNDTKQKDNTTKVVVPDKWFQELFEILEMYNFTIDENSAFDEELSIDPEMLGRIFENLLAEINPETGKSARKSTGSYYTPRVIVDYMVDESLYLYLKNKTGIEEGKLRALISYDLDDDVENPLNENEKQEIIIAIDELKILDPACGSGAFPMGILQKIVFMLQRLDPNGQYWFKAQIKNVPVELRRNLEREHGEKNFDYIRKLGVIRRNIFGVDIQPIATEISRLRCFLTLIVDQKVDDTKENRGIDPLPNLDFKFVTANSLVGLPEKDVYGQTDWLQDESGIENLRELREEFFNADITERDSIIAKFSMMQRDMALRNSKDSVGDYTKYLTEWNPFSHGTTPWFESEWMFGVKDGFDIVIGNPPYVQLQKNGGVLARMYEKEGFQTLARTGDIYTLFYEKGNELLNTNGHLVYITSNKWMRAGYGEKLRKYLSEETTPIVLIDLGPDIFETATVDTNILIFKKGLSDEKCRACILKEDFNDEGFYLNDYVKLNSILLDKFTSDSWLILSPIERSIKEKIEKYGTSLKDWDIQINYGIKTGCNEAFIIDGKKKDELIKQDPKSAEIIRPILRGRDIKRYSYEFADKYVILAYFGSYKILPSKYPAIYNHLKQYEEKLKERGQCRYTSSGRTNNNGEYLGQHHWLELDNNPRLEYLEEFNKQKIIYSEIVQSPQFFLDERGEFFVEATSFLITGEHLDYLVDWLNSSIIAWVFKQFYAGGGLGKKGFRYKKKFLEQLPIPKPRNDMKYENTNDLIKAYLDLTDEETNFISSSVNL